MVKADYTAGYYGDEVFSLETDREYGEFGNYVIYSAEEQAMLTVYEDKTYSVTGTTLWKFQMII